MNRRNIFLSKKILFFVIIVCLLSGCPKVIHTINYPAIQGDFNRGEYQKVDAELSDATINALDPKLQFNAYTLKAFSEWQTGKLAEAKQTAAAAMAKPGLEAGSRDKLWMSILPTIIDEQLLYDKFQRLPEPKRITVQAYKNDYESGYKQVAASLKDAYNKAPADTPDSAKNYVHCVRGNTLFHWKQIISRIWNDATDVNKRRNALQSEADAQAQQFLGNPLMDEINMERTFPCPEAKELVAAKGSS